MTRNIMVCLDGSLLAERALAPAQEIAELDDSTLRLVRVVPDYVPVECGRDMIAHPWTEQDKTDVTEYLETVAQGVSGKVEIARPVGETVPKLLDEAKKANLLVMTSHGRTGFERMLLGSVAEKVIRETPVPVLIVRSQPFHIKQVKRILVPLDGSELAEEALEQARIIAEFASAELVLCQVLDNGYLERTTPEILESRHQALNKIQEYLEETGRNLPPEIKYQCHWETGSPARTLIGITQAQKIDLIVMTTHGRNGLDRLAWGSVAENVVRGSIAPIILVPKKPRA